MVLTLRLLIGTVEIAHASCSYNTDAAHGVCALDILVTLCTYVRDKVIGWFVRLSSSLV